MSQTGNRRPSGARRLTPEQRRRILERRRRQKQKKRMMIAASAAALVVLCVVLAIALPAGNRREQDAAVALPTAEPAMSDAAIEATGGADAQDDGEIGENSDGYEEPNPSDEEAGANEPDAAATPEATDAPVDYDPPGGVFVFDDAYAAAARGAITGPSVKPDLSKVDAAKLERWPEVTEGYIPVIWSAKNVTDKVIAITVDDCFQPNNLRKIVQCALDNGGRLTIFPIGANLAKDNIAEAVKWAWESGMEIENHSYNHDGMYHYEDARMIKEVWAQGELLNRALGVSYQQHFFRPKGGDERMDQRVHAYVNQLGMTGIAMWSVTGSAESHTVSSLVASLAPGEVYLFHTTNSDLQKLLAFIPQAVSQGYRLVTLNELFGLPENETGELVEQNEAPAMEPFRIVAADLKKTTYCRAAAVVQKRLIQLGWLSGTADGIFGDSSYKATLNFQKAAGLKADGMAGAKTQVAMFADDAPSTKKKKK